MEPLSGAILEKYIDSLPGFTEFIPELILLRNAHSTAANDFGVKIKLLYRNYWEMYRIEQPPKQPDGEFIKRSFNTIEERKAMADIFATIESIPPPISPSWILDMDTKWNKVENQWNNIPFYEERNCYVLAEKNMISGANIREKLDLGHPINRICCLGLASMTPSSCGSGTNLQDDAEQRLNRTYLQHIVVREIIEQVQQKLMDDLPANIHQNERLTHPNAQVEVFLLNPEYTVEDFLVLKKKFHINDNVIIDRVNDPEGWMKINERTFVITFGTQFPVRQNIEAVTRNMDFGPAAIICSPIENYEAPDLPTPHMKTWLKGYERFVFASLSSVLFGWTCLHIYPKIPRATSSEQRSIDMDTQSPESGPITISDMDTQISDMDTQSPESGSITTSDMSEDSPEVTSNPSDESFRMETDEDDDESE